MRRAGITRRRKREGEGQASTTPFGDVVWLGEGYGDPSMRSRGAWSGDGMSNTARIGTDQKSSWMTVQEVADYLSVSPGTVRNWVSHRYIPHARRGRAVRFHRARIEEWLSDNPVGATCASAKGHTTGSGGLSRDAEDVLVRARRRPDLTLTALYSDLGLSGYKGNRCKEELIRSGLVEEVELPTNRRGRKKRLLQTTPKGREYLERLGVRCETKGRGGVKHLYYQGKLKEWYVARGYTAEVEATVGGTCVDLLVIRKDGSRLGIEVALSPQYEATNAWKALQVGLEGLLFVCESKEAMEALQRRLEPLLAKWSGQRPGFKLVSEYVGD